MPDSLLDLEARRADLLGQLISVGDFRRGSITATFGKCGKPTCHCAQPQGKGHGPNHRLTRRVKGKTVTETFAAPADLRKAQQEVAAFHHFQDLCQQLIAVNERICRARPVEDTFSPEEKKRSKRSARKSRVK